MRRTASAWARLLRTPRRFHFDAAMRVLLRAARTADPADAVRFQTSPGVGSGLEPGLAFPSADISAVLPPEGGKRPRVVVALMGLTGAMGVLPRFYSEILAITLRDRSRAMADFLDVLSHRTIAQFTLAGIKYRLNRAAEAASVAVPPGRDPVSEGLLALTGYGTANLVSRLAAGADPLLHYSGFFSARPRSADRLRAIVSDWLGRDVEVRQFEGAWLFLLPDQRTAMPLGRRLGAFNRLAVDAAIGIRAWDVQARIVLRIGPLDRPSFEALLPDQPGLRKLVSLVRAYLGFETGFAINPVLAANAVPQLRLCASADVPPRLGWNTWTPGPVGTRTVTRRGDARDAVFEAEVVEAEAARADALAARSTGRTT